MELLSTVNSPKDLKRLRPDQLPQLCEELRRFLIRNVPKTGGHLASNLGVVELTVALHLVYDAPYDKILFDVGHQSYVHKILTGRKDLFNTLRKHNGLSGFQRICESPYDAFGAGHSSTSISAALGFAQARKITGDDYNVVAVIGDGSLSGGMAYEALNNAGRIGEKITVILNENEMSISENVGAMATYLADIRSRQGYFRLKDNVKHTVLQIPYFGEKLVRWIETSKGVFKDMLYPSCLFEDMGFIYLGPVDGNDLEKVTSLLRRAKSIQYPTLVHVLTKKGKGYRPAEKNPCRFHSVACIPDKPAGIDVKVPVKCSTYTDIFSHEIVKLACKDYRITAITAAMAEGTGLFRFQKQFPERFYDVAIAEQHAVTFACGLAAAGVLPVFAVYSSFLQRGFDQIIHDAAIQKLHIVLCIDRAGLVGEDGATHHGIFDASFLSSIPGVTVYTPATAAELRTTLSKALYNETGPVAVRYAKGAPAVLPVPDFSNDFLAVYGKSSAKAVLITYGRLAEEVVHAAELLRKQGIEAKVIRLKKIAPLSEQELKNAVGPTPNIILFAEEGIQTGGIGEHATFMLHSHYPHTLFAISAIHDFPTHGTIQELLCDCRLDAVSLAEHLQTLLSEDSRSETT